MDWNEVNRLKTVFDKRLLMREVEKGNEPIVIESDNQFDTDREERRLKQYNRREILKLDEAKFHKKLISSDGLFNKELTTEYIRKNIKKNAMKHGDIIYIGQNDGRDYGLTGFGIVDLSNKNLYYEARTIFYRIFQSEEMFIEYTYSGCCEEPFVNDIYTPDYLEYDWVNLDDLFTKYYNLNYSQAIYDIRKFKRDYTIYVSHRLYVEDDGVEEMLSTA